MAHCTTTKIMRFSLGGYDTTDLDEVHWYTADAQGTLPWENFGDTEEMLILLDKHEITHIDLDINNGPESSTCPGYTAGGELADGVHTVAAVLSWHKRLG